MGYRSDVRIVTSRKGYEELKKFVENYLKDDKETENLLKSLNVCKIGKDQCYFGWNYVKWYQYDYKDDDAIMEGLYELGSKEFSYRFLRIGESYDDIEEDYCTYEEDLEYPSLIREFDDNYVMSMIKEVDEKTRNVDEENKDEVDI